MAQCLNCKANMGCGCNKRVASDGTSCCNNCIGAYESKIKNNNSSNNNVQSKGTRAPRINNVHSRRP